MIDPADFADALDAVGDPGRDGPFETPGQALRREAGRRLFRRRFLRVLENLPDGATVAELRFAAERLDDEGEDP